MKIGLNREDVLCQSICSVGVIVINKSINVYSAFKQTIIIFIHL